MGAVYRQKATNEFRGSIVGFEAMLEQMLQTPGFHLMAFCCGYMRQCQRNELYAYEADRSQDDIDFYEYERVCRDQEKRGVRPHWKYLQFHCCNATYPLIEFRVVGTKAQNVQMIHFYKDLQERSASLLASIGMQGECLLSRTLGGRIYRYTYKKPWSILQQSDDLLDNPIFIAHKFHDFWLLFIDVWNLHFPENQLCNRFLHEDRALLKRAGTDMYKIDSLFSNPRNKRDVCRDCEETHSYKDCYNENGEEKEEEEEEEEEQKIRYNWIASDLYMSEERIRLAVENMKLTKFDPCKRYKTSWDYPIYWKFARPIRFID